VTTKQEQPKGKTQKKTQINRTQSTWP